MLVAMSLAPMPTAPAYPADVIRIVDPGLQLLTQEANQMGNGRGNCAMVVHPALTWETDASCPSATRPEVRMNN
jgi:hypothetical protein